MSFSYPVWLNSVILIWSSRYYLLYYLSHFVMFIYKKICAKLLQSISKFALSVVVNCLRALLPGLIFYKSL